MEGVPAHGKGRNRKYGKNRKTVRGGVEGYELVVGGVAPDHDAADQTVERDYGMDEAYSHDFSKADGGEGSGPL